MSYTQHLNKRLKKCINLGIVSILTLSSLSTNVIAETKEESVSSYTTDVLESNASEVSAIEQYALSQTDDANTDSSDSTVVEVPVEEPEEGATTDDIVKSLTENEETTEFKKEQESGRNPYNIEQGDSEVFFAESELLLIQNFDGKQASSVYDTFLTNIEEKTESDVKYKVNSGNRAAPIANSNYANEGNVKYNGQSVTTGGVTYKSNFKTASTVNNASTSTNYSLVRAVAFNPFGRKRDNCVAYVALKICKNTSHSDASLHADVVTWMYDFVTQKKSEEVLLGTYEWSSIDDEAYYCEMLNFMAITAGDYDSDGKDTAVIYFAGRGRRRDNDTGLVEISWKLNEDNSISYESKQDLGKNVYGDSTLIHPLYTTGGKTSTNNWQKSEEVYNKLTCSLDTGDFNGDGIEDLAVLTSVGAPEQDDKSNMLRYVPYLAVAYGEKDAELGSVLKNKQDGTYVELKEKTEDSYTYWNVPRNPGLAVGDANGDDVDEIAVAGSKYTIKAEKNRTNPDAKADSSSVYDSHDFDSMVVAIYSAQNNALATESMSSSIKTNTWKSTGLSNDNELPRSGVEFFKINGPGNQEQLFIDGTIYSFISGSCIISNINGDYTPYYFQHNDKGAGPWVSVTNAYIVSVVAGNFDGNIAGREQLMFIVGLKSSGKHNDSTTMMSIGGTYKDLVKTDVLGKEYTDYQLASGYYDTAYDSWEYYLNRDDDSDVEDGFSSEIVAVDIDDDGFEYEYTGMEMAYSDAEIQAVLQATPMFAELGQSYGSTTYSVSTSYSNSSGSSESQGFDVSGVFNASTMGDAVPGVSISIHLGYQYSTNKSWSISKSKSYSTSFSASNENLVILRRLPFYQYNYVVKNKAKQDSGEYQKVSVLVGQAPKYLQLNVKEYNNIVESYNKKLEEKWVGKTSLTTEPTYLTQINETSLTNNEGNPWGYSKAIGGTTLKEDQYVATTVTGGVSNEFSSTPTWIALGNSGGSVSVSMSETLVKNQSWSNSDGWTGGFSISYGVSAINGGISFNAFRTTGNSGSSSSSEGTGISTYIYNMSLASITKGNAASEDTAKKYGFDWALAAGNIQVGYRKTKNNDETTETPIYANFLHYVVKDVTAPVEPVKLVSLDQGKDTEGNATVTLTWKVNSTRNSCKDDSGNAKACTVKDLSFRVYERNESSGSDWAALSTSAISDSSIVENSDGTLSYTFKPTNTTQGNVYGYAIRSRLKYDGELGVESINSNSISYVATNAVSGLSAYELAVKQGFEGSLDEWLDSLVGSTGTSAYELARSKGYTGTEEEWLESLRGTNGTNGLSAYELARNQGYTGTLNDWFASLMGAEGKSAYDIAVDNGYVGDEESWMQSLQGKSTYDIYVDLKQLPEDKILSLEQVTDIDNDDSVTSRYQTYVEALKETDANIKPLSEDEFINSYIANGGAYDSFVGLSSDGNGWLERYITKVLPQTNPLTDDQIKAIFEELSTMSELNFKENTKDCKTVEDYAKKYVELVNIAGSSVVNKDRPEGAESLWTDVDLDQVIEGKSVLERALTIWKESLTLPKTYDVYTSTAKNLNSDNYSEILNEADWLDSLKNGTDGKDGKSAYELAKDKGYTGTEEEWLASLNGKNGTDGASGESAYQIAVNNGYQGSVTDWLASLKGDKGNSGSDGKSAYQIAVENGFNGTVNDWLKSLIGASTTTTNNTETQSQVISGTNGLSAYQIAVANGYSGSVAEWLNSLVGAKGDTGEAGRGIAYVSVNKEGHLIVTYTDNTYEDAGAVVVEGNHTTGRDPLVYVALILAILAFILSALRYYAVYKKKHKSNN